MKVKEKGNLGPLKARKVAGFRRTLVSVSSLVDMPKCKEVVFNSQGVFIRTNSSSEPIHIGSRMANNLYSFDGVKNISDLSPP